METEAKNLVVNFWSQDRGFIFFKISIGESIFESRFSDVFDPIPHLRAWLESITTGVEQCSFSYATEGEDPTFNYHSRYGNSPDVFFEGENEYNEKTRGVYARVDRHQFVNAFYTTFLDFLSSETFINTDWDAEMRSSFKSKIIEEYLAEMK